MCMHGVREKERSAGEWRSRDSISVVGHILFDSYRFRTILKKSIVTQKKRGLRRE